MPALIKVVWYNFKCKE